MRVDLNILLIVDLKPKPNKPEPKNVQEHRVKQIHE